MTPITALHRALDQAQAFGPFYEGGFFNHLPMALHAAWELGADGARLAAQVHHDAPELSAAPPSGASVAHDWRELLGRREAHAELRSLIKSEIEERGAEAVLRSHVPVLISASHAALFHGLIRTAHAWESRHAQELASALAAWACTWETLPGGSRVAVMSPEDWQRSLQEAGRHSDHRMGQARLREAAQSARYAELCDALAPATHWALRREHLLGLALDGYLGSRNFVVLHLITGLRALRVLGPFVPDWPDVQTWLTRAFTGAWMGANIGGLEQRKSHAEPPPWPELQAAALAQFDEHVIKLVHACRQEDWLKPDARWRQAAALALG
ncbi:MAG TPA: questin oxidase family protein [Burkholderiaceae bacterium]|jgi:hypothetical protein